MIAFEDPAADLAWAADGVIVDPSPTRPADHPPPPSSDLDRQRERRRALREARRCVRCWQPVEDGREATTCTACAQKISAYLREKRGGRPWHCGFCGGPGHNQRTCRDRLARGEEISL